MERSSNRFENEVIQHCESLGAEVLTRGWPDLLIRMPDGMIAAVEIKSRTDRLHGEQAAIHEMLEQAGLPVFVVNEEKGRADLPTLPARQTRLERYIFRSVSGKIEVRMANVNGRYVTELQKDLESARRRRDELLAIRASGNESSNARKPVEKPVEGESTHSEG